MINYIIAAVDMVTRHGWKLLPQVSLASIHLFLPRIFSCMFAVLLFRGGDHKRPRSTQSEQCTWVGSVQDSGSYSPVVLKNILNLVLQIFVYLEVFECNTTSDQKLYYIQVCKSWRKRQRMFFRMVGEYGP